MAGLQQAGLEWVSKNFNPFLRVTQQGSDAMEETGKSAEKSSSGFDVLNNVISTVVSTITTVFIGAVTNAGKALIGLSTESVAMAGEFQGMASKLTIAAGAAGDVTEQYGGMGEVALQVGGDTRLLGVSATGAATAMTDLLLAGIPLEDVLGDLNGYMSEGAELGGVLRSSIDLAAASEFDMVEASGLASSTMAQFGIESEDVSGVLDYFIKSADASATDITGIRDALGNAGPVMRGFGFTAEETADQIALLSNVGISGAEAGTALRSMWTNITKDSPKVIAALEAEGIQLADNEGNYRDYVDIMRQFEVAMSDMTEAEASNFAQVAAGSYGKGALLALVNQGTEGYNNYRVALEAATGIEERAAIQSETFGGQLEAMQGNIETLKIRIGTALLPVITDLIGQFSELVSEHGPAITSFFENIGKFATFAFDTIKEFVSGDIGMEDLIPADSPLMDTLETIQGLFNTLGDWWKQNGPAIQQSSSEMFDKFAKAGKDLSEKVLPFINEQIEKFSEWFVDNGPLITEYIGLLQERWSLIAEKVVEFWDVVEPIFSGLFEQIGNIATLLMEVATGDWSAAWETIKEMVSEAWITIQETFVAFADFVTGFLGTTWQGVIDVWSENWETFKLIVSTVWDNIKTAIGEKFTEVQTAITTKIEEVKAGWEMAWNSIQTILTTVWDNIKLAISEKLQEIAEGLGIDLDAMKEKWSVIWEDVRAIVSEVWSRITTVIGEKIEEVRLFIEEKVAAIKELWTIAMGEIETFATTVWTNIATFIGEKIEDARLFIEEKVTAIKEFWGPIWDEISLTLSTIWDGIIDSVTEKAEGVHTAVTEKIQEIQDWISGKVEAFTTIGGDLIAGLKDGILNAAGDLAESVTTAVEGAIASAKEALGISSPSRVFEKIGEDTTKGLGQGIEKMTEIWKKLEQSVKASIARLRQEIRTRFTALVNWWTNMWNQTVAITEESWDRIQLVIDEKIIAIQEIIVEKLDVIMEIWESTFTFIREFTSSTLDAVIAIATQKLDSLKTIIVTKIGQIKDAWEIEWNKIKGVITTVFNQVKTIVETKMGQVKDEIEGVIGGIETWLGLQAPIFYQLGSDIMQGFMDGMIAKFQMAVDHWTYLIAQLKKEAEEGADISSPSKVFEKIGAFISEGFLKGLQSLTPEIHAQIEAMVTAPVASMAAPSVGIPPGSVINNNTTEVNISAAYSEIQSETDIAFDVNTALAIASL